MLRVTSFLPYSLGFVGVEGDGFENVNKNGNQAKGGKNRENVVDCVGYVVFDKVVVGFDDPGGIIEEYIGMQQIDQNHK